MKVIKLGGSLLDDAQRRGAALTQIAAAWRRGESLVLIHGGGKHIDAMMKRLGIPKRTHAGLRITDDETLQIVVAVLGGIVNKMLVSELTALGIPAAGISGNDGGTLIAEQHPPIDGVDLGHVGRVVSSNATVVDALLHHRVLPVVSSIAQGPGGTLLNVNADSAASALAVGLKAHTLHFITDVAGLLDRNGEVVRILHPHVAEEFLASDVVSGGMRPKLEAALIALRHGVQSIAIGENGGTNLVAA